MSKEVLIEESWKSALADYFTSPSWQKTADFVRGEYEKEKIFPLPANIFRAFSLTPHEKVKVVILGQDPYHGDGQAEGLSFSVPLGVRVPPSLQNIYKEIETDCGVTKDFSSGSLVSWAEQGVLLLNSVLTVRAGLPASHAGKGWEDFTDTIITTLSEKSDGVVFMLWGKYAQGKKDLIDASKHLILLAPHPSPFSAHTGFLGCRHFSRANEYLKEKGKESITW